MKSQIEFRLAKGPDFKSRLDAYLNVVGPNQRQTARVESNRYVFAPDPADIFFPIRRALMLRAELKCSPEAKLDIDEGVLNALLRVPEFKHGSRSLAKLLQPFPPHSSGPLVRSMLPPSSQIAMHTDAKEFLQLCDSAPRRALTPVTLSGAAELSAADPLNESEIAVLAPAVHNKYQALGVKAGWLEKGKERSFDNLDDFDKDSNRAAARRMIRILDLLSLRLVPGQNTPDERQSLSRLFEFHLELLAEAEHAGWMQWHIERGWRYDPLTDGNAKDKSRKLHTCLLPFKQLKHADQEKDRESIRAYLDFAQLANKQIVPSERDTAGASP
ncbi:MAG: RyR domain-containing protein [Planctomycetota bacterium]